MFQSHFTRLYNQTTLSIKLLTNFDKNSSLTYSLKFNNVLYVDLIFYKRDFKIEKQILCDLMPPFPSMELI